MSALAHVAGEKTDWQVVAVFRSFLVFAFVGIYAVARGEKLVLFRPRQLWVRSCAGSVSLVTGFYALAQLPASTVTTLTSTYPIWVAILAWPMLGARPHARVWFAVIGSVCGVYLIHGVSDSGDQLAVIVALVSALSTSIAMLGLNRIRGVGPVGVVVHFSAVATIVSLLSFMLFPTRSDAVPFYDPTIMALLVGVGLTASGGQMMLTRAFSHGDPPRVAVVGLSQVVFALIIDVTFANHPVTATMLIGIMLVLAPTAWVMLDRIVKKREPQLVEPRPAVTIPVPSCNLKVGS